MMIYAVVQILVFFIVVSTAPGLERYSDRGPAPFAKGADGLFVDGT